MYHFEPHSLEIKEIVDVVVVELHFAFKFKVRSALMLQLRFVLEVRSYAVIVNLKLWSAFVLELWASALFEGRSSVFVVVVE